MKNFNLIGAIAVAVIGLQAKAENWDVASGIPEDVSITSINTDNNKTYGFGLRQWREGVNFMSEPKSFISDDDGRTWEEFIPIKNDLSVISAYIMIEGRLLTSGRKGPTQLDWVGGVFYTDNNGETWSESNGIPNDISILKFQKCEDVIVATGQRQWREGMNFLSEPKAFISKDNGVTWTEGMKITDEISTCNGMLINGTRMIVSGRLGQAQLDWIGAIMYTDDNGSSWQRSTGIPNDVSINSMILFNGEIIAIGQKQWRDGMTFLSEAKCYKSNDNGSHWEEWIKIGQDLTSALPLCINEKTLVTAGRKGQTQLDWIGEVIYTTLP